MYTLSRAFVQQGRQWESVDVSNLTFVELFQSYKNVIFVLIVGGEERAVLLNDLDKSLRYNKTTVSDWLVDNTKTLPWLPTVPNIDHPKSVFYADVFDHEFTVKRSDHTKHIDSPNIGKMGPDALITHEGIDYVQLAKHSLFTVNGYVHRVSASSQGLYVLRAGETLERTDSNHFGLINFSQLGEIQTHPIKEEQVKVDIRIPAHEQVMVTLPDVDFSTKTVLLCIGGYLVMLDDTYQVVGDHTLKISFKHYPLIRRVLLSREDIQLDDLINPIGNIQVKDIQSSSFIRRYLSHPFSFIITIDNDNIALREERLQETGLPGKFRSAEIPQGILMDNEGLIAEYSLIGSPDDYLVSARVKEEKQLLLDTVMDLPIAATPMRFPTSRRDRQPPRLVNLYTVL
ncbi:MAG: hypothetical protein CMF37_14835 [Leeuwenhoekiella sp.]|nr:hypothetical protein [Leeuwenhoekiella sp.]MBQ50110.1 hypothetical protein [Leeuwenhoekiella sp.]MBQ50307.1 hypothetical protein [Leeuwenhoekiella sp.]MBQ50504.1 hypothetical protein [Leeuwenhoekiella sp.]